jgi:hypothetical protein
VKLRLPERIPDKPVSAAQRVAARPGPIPEIGRAREASRGRDDTSSLEQGWEHE